MNAEDLKMISLVGRALWADPRRAEPLAVETITAVSLLDLNPPSSLERTMRALLDRAIQEGMAFNTRVNLPVILPEEHSFYHLMPQERFLLVALHLGRWSYARLARVMDETQERVEEMAWTLRVQLAPGRYPAGPSAPGPRCPDYDTRRPWTQRFLDEEIRTVRERHFFQNHLMACDPCRHALSRCRDVYYAVDRIIPRFAGEEKYLATLKVLFRESRKFRVKDEVSFLQSLQALVRRHDVQAVLAGLALLLLFAWLR